MYLRMLIHANEYDPDEFSPYHRNHGPAEASEVLGSVEGEYIVVCEPVLAVDDDDRFGTLITIGIETDSSEVPVSALPAWWSIRDGFIPER